MLVMTRSCVVLLFLVIEKINVLSISQSSNQHKISAIVMESELINALQAICAVCRLVFPIRQQNENDNKTKTKTTTTTTTTSTNEIQLNQDSCR